LEDARESGKGVERLESGISRIAQPLVTEAQIQRETRGHLPVILNKPVNPVLIAGKGAGSRTPQGAIETVRNSVVNQSLQAGVVPLSTGAWQEVSRSDPVPPLCAKLERVRSPNYRDVVEELIIVLRIALRGIALRADVQSQVVHDHVGEVQKLLGNRIGLHETRVRQAEIVGETWGGGPGIRKNDLA